MMRYQGYNGTLIVDGDDLVISRQQGHGPSGGDPGARRLPLTDVEGAFLSSASLRERRLGYLQLVLAGKPDYELTQAQAERHRDVITFTPDQQPAFEALEAWLEEGGRLTFDSSDLPQQARSGPAPVPVPPPPSYALAAMPSPEPQRSWFARHKVLTGSERSFYWA